MVTAGERALSTLKNTERGIQNAKDIFSQIQRNELSSPEEIQVFLKL